MVVHMSIRLDGAETWEGEAVLSEELAEVDVWVGILAGLRSFFGIVFVEEVHLVDVFGAPLDSINWLVEEAASFPHSCDEGAADHRLAIVVLPRVLPAVLLDNCH